MAAITGSTVGAEDLPTSIFGSASPVSIPGANAGTATFKPPFAGPEHLLHYLARNTHRVAISNRGANYLGASGR